MKIDDARLLADLRALARFGGLDPGVHRLSYSPEDRAARQWLEERMEAAGLEARIDGLGNVYGRARGVERALLIGSHTDTVPNGGWLDGAFGVICGLEIARAYRESGARGPVGVDVISFADEEGRYLGTAGSMSFCGELTPDHLATARDPAGRTLADALAEAGYAGRPPSRLDPARHVAYLEAHIEQGPRLEAAGARIGVVTGIVGVRRYLAVFEGQADHAGTTPMGMRKDAGAAALDFAHSLDGRLSAAGGPDSVWNFGLVSFEPGAPNVVPRRAVIAIECRDLETAVLDRMEAPIFETATEAARRRNVNGRVAASMSVAPAHMDPGLGETLAAAAADLGAPAMRLASGAGHDAQVLARHLPSAMLFVPSIAGRSHDVSEDTREADIILGARVLAAAVERLMR